jgi:ketosteroid isomerase-like protein
MEGNDQAASRANIADVTTLVRALNGRDRDGMSRLLHPEFEFHALIGAVEQRIYTGADGMWVFLDDMDSTWDGYRVELGEVRGAGGCAVALMRISGTARASGLPLSRDIAQVITWRDGTVWRVVAYAEPAEALEAVGLAE